MREYIKQGKLSYPFHPEPYSVTYTKGNMITAANSSHTITRNSSRFRKVPFDDTGHYGVIEDEPEPDIVNNDNNTQEAPQMPDSPITQVTPKRSTRERRKPKYLEDYVAT